MESQDTGFESRVVRSDSMQVEPAYPTTRLLKSAVFDAERAVREAEARRQQAELEARQAVERAQEEVQRIREEARREASREVAEEFRGIMKAFQSGLSEARQQVVDRLPLLALDLARRVVMAELRVNPETFGGMVQEVVESAGDNEPVSVHLHPEDFGATSSLREHIMANAEHEVSFVADPDVSRRSVLVRKGMGEYFASIEQRFEALEKELGSDSSEGERDGR